MQKINLKASNLSKFFNKKLILDNINFDIKEDEIIAVLGKNGAGKSTLFKILINVIKQNTGKIDHLKDDIKISYVNNNHRAFYWRLTGRQNLEFFSGLRGIAKSKINTQIYELSEFFDCSQIIDTPFSNYSSGQMQAISLIRGLIDKPDILLLDEPTSNLDIHSSQALKEKIFEYKTQSGSSILWSSHRVEEINDIYDRAFIINDRKLHHFSRNNKKPLSINIELKKGIKSENFIKKLPSNLHLKIIDGKSLSISRSSSSIHDIFRFIGDNIDSILKVENSENALERYYLEKIR